MTHENGQTGIEVIAFIGCVGGYRVFYFYGVSDMSEKDTELWNRFERFVQEQETDIQSLASVFRENWGFPKSMCVSLAREVYIAGWRKVKKQ